MPKVLMLGWEFPPLFSGGLGVATYGIVKALRSKASIKLIVPGSDPHHLLENVTIIGLNNALKKELSGEKQRFNLSSILEEVYRIPLTMSPYHAMNIATESHAETEEERLAKRASEKLAQFFTGPDVYGSDIMRKVHLFAELADQLAEPADFDIIHAHDWVTYPAALKIKERTGKKLVLHVHALETDRAGENTRNEIYKLEKSALDKADRIMAVSHYTKEQLSHHYNIPQEKITVVYNGIDPKEPKRKQHRLKDKIVVFLGRITHQKGPHFLLETASKVLRVYPRVKFVVAGTGDQFAHLLETAAYRKLGSKFIFTGFLSKVNVDELLTMADVYFMPSVSEPFGLTALEAAQHHVPGVLSLQSGAGEVLTASLKADFWDTDKYANYIYALLKYNALHKELAEKAHAELQQLTWDHSANTILQEYTKLMQAS